MEIRDKSKINTEIQGNSTHVINASFKSEITEHCEDRSTIVKSINLKSKIDLEDL